MVANYVGCNGGFNMSSPSTVVFVCEHGAAKSLIAAAYWNRLAESSGVQVRAIARGTDPEPALLPTAVAGLRADGLVVTDDRPRRATAEELASAAIVVSFGPRLDGLAPDRVPHRYWDGLPAVSDGYDTARDVIVTQVTALLADPSVTGVVRRHR
jgi:arsenate reductase (thioredoxin)